MIKRPTSLRFRLMFLVVTAILPIFGLMLYQAAREQDRKLRECEDEARRLATQAAGSISQATEGARQMLLALACTEPVRTMNAEATAPLLADLLGHSKSYVNIGLVRSDGLVLASAVPMKEAVYIDDRLWFRTLRETGELAVSEYLIGRISGKAGVNLGFPLYPLPGNPFPGALYASLDLKMIQRCLAQIHLPAHAVILVVDKKGTCVARRPEITQTGVSARSWVAFQEAGARVGVPVTTVGNDGTLRDYHYVNLPGIEGLMVAVGISRADATEESRAAFRRNLYILAFWTAASLGLAGLIGQASVLKNVDHLSATARRLAAQDWSASAAMSGGASEIRQLASTFDAMAAALRRQNEDLEEQVWRRTAELSATNASLTDALAQVTTLNGLLPICSGCKKIRDDQGYWSQIEHYISAHSGAQFSHSLCPDCAKKYFPELNLDEPQLPGFSPTPQSPPPAGDAPPRTPAKA
ncbi:MAG: HAMP domain-containing protein [Chthoniobacteraceae bacterium]